MRKTRAATVKGRDARGGRGGLCPDDFITRHIAGGNARVDFNHDGVINIDNFADDLNSDFGPCQ